MILRLLNKVQSFYAFFSIVWWKIQAKLSLCLRKGILIHFSLGFFLSCADQPFWTLIILKRLSSHLSQWCYMLQNWHTGVQCKKKKVRIQGLLGNKYRWPLTFLHTVLINHNHCNPIYYCAVGIGFLGLHRIFTCIEWDVRGINDFKLEAGKENSPLKETGEVLQFACIYIHK